MLALLRHEGPGSPHGLTFLRALVEAVGASLHNVVRAGQAAVVDILRAEPAGNRTGGRWG